MSESVVFDSRPIGLDEPLALIAPPVSGRGGDITFTPGRGFNKNPRELVHQNDGAIVFCDAHGGQWMRLESDGKVTVRGQPVDDPEPSFVYQNFKTWLIMAISPMTLGPAPVDVGPDCVVVNG